MARQRTDGENEDREFEEIIDLYWNGKEKKTARAIPLKTDRQIKIVEAFNDQFGHFDKPVGSYEHVRRRLTRTIELVDGIDAIRYKPYINRATAVSHFAWAGMDDAGLTYNYGWADPGTIERYRARSGTKAAEAMDKMYGRDTTQSFDLDPDPPTWSEYRSEADQHLEVKNWTPKTSGETELPPEKEEKALKDRTLQEFISHDDSTANGVAGVGAAVSLAVTYSGLAIDHGHRFVYQMIFNPEGNDVTSRRGKKRALSAIVGILAGVLLMGAVGYSTIEIGAIVIASLLVVAYISNFDEPPTLPLPRKII